MSWSAARTCRRLCASCPWLRISPPSPALQPTPIPTRSVLDRFSTVSAFKAIEKPREKNCRAISKRFSSTADRVGPITALRAPRATNRRGRAKSNPRSPLADVSTRGQMVGRQRPHDPPREPASVREELRHTLSHTHGKMPHHCCFPDRNIYTQSWGDDAEQCYSGKVKGERPTWP